MEVLNVDIKQSNHMNELTTGNIYRIMLSLFPAQNDFGSRDFDEVLRELMLFGIKTTDKFERLMTQHRPRILDIDSGRVKHTGYIVSSLHYLLSDEKNIASFKKANEGNLRTDFDDCLKKRYWLSFVGLVRLALELEFRTKYMTYLEDKWESGSGETTEGDWVRA
ncbi:MAG TPA: hypothetical protein VGD40_19770 [Chryseosolibacter sp.]